MIHERIEQLKQWAREAIAALKETGAAVIRWITSAHSCASNAKPVLVAAKGNVLDMGKRYRKTSGHAPLFALYTFFKDSQ
jgi:Holliday junction resolvase